MSSRHWLLLAPLAVALAWPWLAANRLYDPDEFEHLHAAWSIADGQLPYRDFFEHHGPLTYYLLAPFVTWFGDSPHLLTVHRAISAVWIAIAVAGIAAVVGSRWKLGFGLTWLFTFPWFLEKAVEGRPDVAAGAIMIWVGWLTIKASKTSNRLPAIAAGLAFGVAALFTQKVAFLGLGIVIGGIISRRANGRSAAEAVFYGVVGFLVPWLLAAGWFHYCGGLSAFFERTLFTPLTWPSHQKNADEFLLHRLTNFVSWAPGHLAVFTATVLAGFIRMRSVRRRADGSPVLVCGLIAHLIGAFIVPPYLQYSLIACPIAAALIAREFPALWRRSPTLVAGLIAGGFMAAAWPRWDELIHVRRSFISYLDVVTTGAVLLSALMVVVAGLFHRKAAKKIFSVILLVAAFAPGVGRLVGYHLFWSHAAAQRQELAAFGEISPGPVMDGFTGLGCLRPHVGYWWWINHHSLPLIRKEGALPSIIEAIRNRSPDVIIVDEGVQKLDANILPLLSAGYDQVSFPVRALIVKRRRQ